MTFTEAAVEILRLVGRPLHYKKITELAIERNLLSHVGKAPELTMSSRLATMVKKDRGEEPIVKVKPGVFALREFTPQMMALADADDDIDLSQFPEAAPTPPAAAAPSPEEGVEAAPRPALPGSDVFPAEEDDDKPILAGIDDEDEEEGGERDDRRGRRRRRRRGRGPEEAEAESGAEEVKAEGAEEPPREGRRDRGERDRDRGDRDRGERDRDRGERDRARHDRHAHRDAPRLPNADLAREPAEGDLLGRELADAVGAILANENRPLTYSGIAEQLVRRGRLVGEPASLVPTIAAAVRADIGRAARPRFRHMQDGVALYDWFLPRDAMYRERDLLRAAERHQETVRRSFLRKLSDLPAAGFAEILATWLNAEGITSLRGVRRPTSSPQEMHFAGTLRRGFDEMRVAIVVLRDGRELTRERVVELRGSLHHYGGAALGWIVTTGAVPRACREEATAVGATPIALYDGLSLAEAMEGRGVGMRRTTVPLSVIDLDTLDALRGSPEQPLREDRGGREDRPRDDRREDRPRDERREDRPREDRPREDRGGREDRPREDRPRDEREPTAAPDEPQSTESPVEAAPAEAAPGGADAARAEEGGAGRRRRRRRRRRGGGDRPPQGAAGEVSGDEDDEGSEGEAEEASETSAADAAPSDTAPLHRDADEAEGAGDEAEDGSAAEDEPRANEDELPEPTDDDEDEPEASDDEE
jgi:hypothetical protein